jgi:hypothetical protein
MTGFNITEGIDQITVETEAFTLVFDNTNVGVISFRYEKGGNIHEGVESLAISPILFGPWFNVLINGNPSRVYPRNAVNQSLTFSMPWYAEIFQIGQLSDITGSDLGLMYTAVWHIWPSGRVSCTMRIFAMMYFPGTLLEEAYRLNPSNDTDIFPVSDNTDLKWFGFYSNNTGDNSADLSHDAIAIPLQSNVNMYAVDGYAGRMLTTGSTLPPGGMLNAIFLIALSVFNSWGDSVDFNSLDAHGDAISLDVLHPDPLNGTQNAGVVIVGMVSGNGFDIERCAYTLFA